jgi:hypothetical protein
MVLTRKMIDEARTHGRVKISNELEVLLLTELGQEPLPHTYSEQDIHEQMRKLIQDYNNRAGVDD